MADSKEGQALRGKVEGHLKWQEVTMKPQTQGLRLKEFSKRRLEKGRALNRQSQDLWAAVKWEEKGD